MPSRTLMTGLMLAVLAVWSALAALPAQAADDPPPPALSTMSPEQLRGFVEKVAGTVGKDSLELAAEAKAKDCRALVEAANSFRVAYGYLDHALAEAMARQDQAIVVVRLRAMQARVVTFAARVRAEDWLGRACARYSPAAADQDNPRYRAVPKLSIPDYTEAMVEMRQVAEANLALAQVANTNKDCAIASAAADSIDLFIPYLDTMLSNIQSRPEALGPRASRRGLERARARLIEAVIQLDRDFRPRCGGGAPAVRQ